MLNFVANDYSELVFQLERVGQWERVQTRFRRWDRFWRHGDEIPDTSHLGMWLKVHGVFRQRSSTREMIFDVPTVVSYVIRFMTCCPVISSATEHRLESGWA